MTPRHVHQCGCGAIRTCRRPDCQHYDWQCPECEDQMMSDYFAQCGDQPRLPLDSPETERTPCLPCN